MRKKWRQTSGEKMSSKWVCFYKTSANRRFYDKHNSIPIHKIYFNKSHLFISLVILLRLQLHFILCNDKFTSPQVFSTGFGEVNNAEISMPLFLHTLHKIFDSYCWNKGSLPFFVLALKELVYHNRPFIIGCSVKLSQVVSHFSVIQHVLSYNCLFQIKYKH